MNRFLSLVFTLLLFPVLALGQSTAIVDGIGLANGKSYTNYIKNPNAQKNTVNVTASNLTLVRSTTTPLYSAAEFNLTSTSTPWSATWSALAFNEGLKNRLCEVQIMLRGTAAGTTTLEVLQNSVAAFTQTVTLDASNPKRYGGTFPCGDLTYASTVKLSGTGATTGAIEAGAVYLGDALNSSTVGAASDGTGIKLKSSTNADLLTVSEAGAAVIGPTSSTQYQRLNGYIQGNYGGTSSAYLVNSTADSADSAATFVAGAGDTGAGRGAYLGLYGNEHATHPGKTRFFAGLGASGGTAFDFVSSGGGAIGSATEAGAWTLGPASFAGPHTANGLINVARASASAQLSLERTGTDTHKIYFGVDGTSGLLFGTSAGGVELGKASPAGAWTLGAATTGTTVTSKGFTALGDGNTAIKVKVLTGTTNAAEGGSVAVSHGLTGDKIVGVSTVVRNATNAGVTSSLTSSAGFQFDVSYSSTDAVVSNHATNSENILSKPFAITIMYIQ